MSRFGPSAEAEVGVPAAKPLGSPGLSAALSGVLAFASLGEGGATPGALFWIHAVVGSLLAWAIVFPAGARKISPAPLAAFVVFLAALLVGAVTAPYGFAAWLVVLEVGTFLAVAVLAARCGPDLIRLLAPCLLAGAAVQGGTAIGQELLSGIARPAGTFLNPNHLGAWIVAALLLGLATQTPFLRRWTVPRVAAAVSAASGLVLLRSRGALLALLAGCLVLVLSRIAGPRHRRGAGLAVLACGVVILAGVALIWGLRSGDPFRYNRLRIWRACLQTIAAAPWTGTGPGQFAASSANLNFPLEDGPLRFERSFVSPHSDLLRLPCEFGWPATAALLAAAGLAAFEMSRRTREEGGGARIAAGAALAALAVQSTIDDLSERPALTLLAAALLGSMLSSSCERAKRSAPRVLRVGAVVLLGVVFAAGEAAPYLAWRATRGLPRGRLEEAGRVRLETSLRRNPLHPDLWLRLAEDIAGDGSDWTAERYAASREAAERAVRLQPEDARYRTGLARIEALACVTLFRDQATRQRASRAYAQAEARARYDPLLPIEHGRFLAESGDPGGARRAAERSLAIEPHGIPARLLLAAALLAEGGPSSPDRALEALEEAQREAQRWSRWPRESDYARALLDLDAVWFHGIRSRATKSARSGETVDSGGRSS